MSVINDMLRDLNQRRAPEVAGERAAVPQSLIEPQKNTLKTIMGVLVFVLLVAVVTAYWFLSLKGSLSSGHDNPSLAQDTAAQNEQAFLLAQQPNHPEKGASSIEPDLNKEALQHPQVEASLQAETDPVSSEVSNRLTDRINPSATTQAELTVAQAQPSRMSTEDLSENKKQTFIAAEQEVLPTSVARRASKTDVISAESKRDRTALPEVISASNQSTNIQKLPEAQAAMKVGLSPAARDRQMAEQAMKLFSTGKPEQAYRELVEFLEAHEVDNESRAVLANYLLQENRLAEAGDLLLNAQIQISTSLRQLKARWYAAQGDDKLALYTLNSELPDIKQYPDYYVLLAAYYQKFGWHKEALKTYTALVEYDDSVADWWAGLALAADRTQDFKQAALAYEQALELPGLNPELSRFVQSRLKQLRTVPNTL